MLLEPRPHLEAAGIVFGRQIEVHRPPIQTAAGDRR
jgi:hypothetical protein